MQMRACRPSALPSPQRLRSPQPLTSAVLDDSYRRALALPADRLICGYKLAQHASMLDAVRSRMLPDVAASRLSARLHALNVYTPGGFFRPHRDTPRGGGLVGSLLVCLPVGHSGGQLRVQVRSAASCRCRFRPVQPRGRDCSASHHACACMLSQSAA